MLRISLHKDIPDEIIQECIGENDVIAEYQKYKF